MGSVTTIKIELAIFGDSFIPDALTELLRVSPTKTGLKGEEIPLQKGLRRKKESIPRRKESSWSYSTGFVETFDFEEVSSKIQSKFDSKIDLINSFVEKHHLEVKLFVVTEIVDGETPGIFMNKEFLQFIVRIGAEIDFDLYV